MAVTTEQIKQLRERSGAGMLDCKKALEATNGDVDAAGDWLREKGIAKAAKKADRIAAEGLTAIAKDGNTAVVLEINSETDFVAKNIKFVTLINDVVAALLQAKPETVEAALAAKMGEGTVQEALVSATTTIGEKISFRRFQVVTKTDADIFGTYLHMGGRIASLVVIKNSQDPELAHDVAMHIAAAAPVYVSMNEVPSDFKEKETHIQLEAAKNDPLLSGKPEQVLVKIVEGKVNKSIREMSLNDQAFVKNPDESVGQHVKSHGGEVLSFVRYVVGEGIQKREDNFADEVMNQVRK